MLGACDEPALNGFKLLSATLTPARLFQIVTYTLDGYSGPYDFGYHSILMLALWPNYITSKWRIESHEGIKWCALSNEPHEPHCKWKGHLCFRKPC